MCISSFLFNRLMPSTTLNLHKSFLKQKEGFKNQQKEGKSLHQGRAFDSSRFMFQHNSASECFYNINSIWGRYYTWTQLLQDSSMQRKFPVAHNHSSHPTLPSHLPKKFLCWLNFSFNCFKYFSRGLATFLVFYTASFLFNHISPDRRQLCGRNNPGSGEPCQFFKLLFVSVWFYSWRHLLKTSETQK